MASRTDQLLSQGMGKAKAMKAALKGLSGVFRTLSEQHGQASALLRRLKGNSDRRADLWPTVRTELLAHERAEMEVVYRELHYDPRTRLMAEHHDEEAVQTVQHHVAEEEGEIFPKAQDVIGRDRTLAMDITYEDAFAAQKRMA